MLREVKIADIKIGKRHRKDMGDLAALAESTLEPEAFDRTVNHSEDGPISLRTLLERITNHIPHHVQFIAEKRQAMEAGA